MRRALLPGDGVNNRNRMISIRPLEINPHARWEGRALDSMADTRRAERSTDAKYLSKTDVLTKVRNSSAPETI